MHVLHRPHFHRAIMVTVLAAVLAVVLTLAFASELSEHPSVSGQIGAPSATAAPAVSTSAARPATNPFITSPLSVPRIPRVAYPWTTSSR